MDKNVYYKHIYMCIYSIQLITTGRLTYQSTLNPTKSITSLPAWLTTVIL